MNSEQAKGIDRLERTRMSKQAKKDCLMLRDLSLKHCIRNINQKLNNIPTKKRPQGNTPKKRKTNR